MDAFPDFAHERYQKLQRVLSLPSVKVRRKSLFSRSLQAVDAILTWAVIRAGYVAQVDIRHTTTLYLLRVWSSVCPAPADPPPSSFPLCGSLLSLVCILRKTSKVRMPSLRQRVMFS